MRAYIPPAVYRQLTEEQREMWDKGTVARMLLVTGIPYVGPETVPLVCYRLNLLQYADVCCKAAKGMQAAEIDAPPLVLPEMLSMFNDAVIDGEPFRMKDDEAFLCHMHHKMEQFKLPADKLLEWGLKVGQLLKQADEELQDG